MERPIIKQIQGTINGVLFIAIGAPLLAISYGTVSGEVKHWHDLYGVLDHAGLAALGLICGWIVLASPLAGTFKTYLGTAKEVSVDAAGKVTKSEQTIEVSIPMPTPPTPPKGDS